LKQLNEYLFTEYALNKNTEPFEETATDDFILIAAPGNIENKTQAMAGVGNVNITSLQVLTDNVAISEELGIVVGVLEMDGTIMIRPVPGKIRYSNTFVKDAEQWKLKMRTMTPMRR
tara:strand:+ start:331 stop:681 length:351 start_codon:yes stop_codon:yes gene_type:complete